MNDELKEKFMNFRNDKIFYFLLSGLTYTEIANKYYSRNKNKIIYSVRKLLREFGLQNRRQLIFYAVSNGLIQVR